MGAGDAKLPGLLRDRVALQSKSTYSDQDRNTIMLNDDQGEILFVRFNRKYRGVEAVSIPNTGVSKAYRDLNHEKLKGSLNGIAVNDE